MSSPTQTTTPFGEVDLAVEGMTCAACVNRVEKRLNALPGVTATVNLATESAHVTLDEDVADTDLLAVIERAGYAGTVTRRRTTDEDEDGEEPTLAAPPGYAGEDTSAPAERRQADLLRRLRVSAVLTVPVVVLSMIPALQFPGWQWVITALSLPVVTWGAWPFHRAALRAARYRASTMDTLFVFVEPEYVKQFTDLVFTPDVSRAYEFELTDVTPGERRIVRIEMRADRYGSHSSAISAAHGGDTARADIRTVILP